MNDLLGAAAEIQHFLQHANQRFCFIAEREAVDREERCVARASLLTCSAEDLVVLKAFAGRPRDWAGVETIVARRSAQLDWQCARTSSNPWRCCAR